MNIHSVFNIVVKKFFLLSFERNARTAVRAHDMDNKSDYEPMAFDEFNGLTKLQYAAIQICAGLSANPNFAHEVKVGRIAEMSISQAKELLHQLGIKDQ